jgi:hypothetical protein
MSVMPVNEKQGVRTPPKLKRGAATTPPAFSAEEAAAAKTAAPPADAVGDAVKSTLTDAVFRNRPYLKYAFANPYNLTLLLGALAASALTLNPLIAIAALGLEGLWLLHAPESKLLKRILWDPKFEKLRLALEQQALEERIKGLPERKRERVEHFMARQQEIRRLAAQNPSFTGELLRGELVKTGRLVEAFLEMSLTCSRYEEYLATVNLAELERDRQRWEQVVRQAKEQGPQVEIAKKNLAIIMKRQERLQEIRNYLAIAYGQLDLIENSFQLIADQIVTMQSPQELSGQLDELLDGVESIKQTAADTEKLLNSL